MTETRARAASDYSLGNILSDLLSCISTEQQPTRGSNLLHALYFIYNHVTCAEEMPSSVYEFLLDDNATSDAIQKLRTVATAYPLICGWWSKDLMASSPYSLVMLS